MSYSLVAALVLALFCNVYLLLLLWSGGTHGDAALQATDKPAKLETLTSIKQVQPKISLNDLKSYVNASRRLAIDKRTKSLLSLLQKIQRELVPRNVTSAELIQKTKQVFITIS